MSFVLLELFVNLRIKNIYFGTKTLFDCQIIIVHRVYIVRLPFLTGCKCAAGHRALAQLTF